MIIVLLGPPGAGKGTQAKRIQSRLGLAHVSTGDLFRDAMAEDSDLGRSVKGYLESGRLVPDELTSAVVGKRIERPDCRAGIMLDGFPRTVAQGNALDEMLKARALKLDAVLFFDVTERTAIERLSGRRMCKACGAGYHLKYMPPREADKCDACGEELYQRTDDRPETIRDRLQVYGEQTSSLVHEYERRGLLRKIDANGPPEEIERSVADIMDALPSEEVA